jgi:heme oxygenase
VELATYLRATTAAAHAQLEAALSIISEEPDRRRFLTVLEGFHGFHVVWEKAIRQRPEFLAFYGPRTRLPQLRRDLGALGRTAAEIDALPLCQAAAALADDPDEAVGSIYVLEGSTLGGQLINRALAGADWVPEGGLSYFSPYGRRTGEMWRGFWAWAEERDPEPELAARGAQRTFATLQAWLCA